MSGASRNFDGTNDRVSLGSLWNSTGPASIAFWQYTATGSSVRASGGFGTTWLTDQFSILHPFSDGNVYWDYGNALVNGRISASYSGYYDKWTHICGTSAGASGADMKLYFDGTQVATASVSDGPSGAITMYLGNLDPPGGDNYWFNGQMADFRIYDRQISAVEVGELAAGKVNSVRSGLVVHTLLLGPDATAFLDLSGSGNNGTNSGSTVSTNGPPIFF